MPDQTGMPLIIRYTGSWLRFFSIGPGIFGLLITALLVQLWLNPQPNMNRAFFYWAWILPFLFLAFTTSDLAAKVRFRLTLDGDSVKYRGIIRESTWERANITRLGWQPAGRYTRGSLRFYDTNHTIVIRIDPTLLSAVQLAEISRVMDIPIEGPPTR
jgi:hypothetical protein